MTNDASCINQESSSGWRQPDLNAPKVSIGMPVYNGEPYLRNSLSTLLAQTYTNFELIISDNASIDGTAEICREYAEKDSRIRYVRQQKNRGATENFLFVLEEAVGEYFMWAAADDTRSEDYLELNISFLEKNLDFVASTSPVRTEDGDFDPILMGDFALDDAQASIRIYKFFSGWHANGRFYSLMRRDAIMRMPKKYEEYLGADWGWVVFLAREGKMNRVNDGWVILGVSGDSRVTNVFKKYNDSILSFMLPLRKLSKISMGYLDHAPLFLKFLLFSKLFILNVHALALNVKFFLRPVGR